MNSTTVVFPEEVYSKYHNTAGNLIWVGVHSGEHLVRVEPRTLQREKEMKEMYKDNAGNWRYGIKGEELPGVSYSADSIPIKWLCDYAVIIAENNYEQAKFIFRLIENYKCELNEDKDKAATENLKRLKENWLKTKEVEKESRND